MLTWDEKAAFMADNNLLEARWSPVTGDLIHAVRVASAPAPAKPLDGEGAADDEEEDDGLITFRVTQEAANILMSLVGNVVGNSSAYDLYWVFRGAGCKATYNVSTGKDDEIRLLKIEEGG